MTKKLYRYRGCGLDYIYLMNGFQKKETKYGRSVSIHDMDGLHRAIGMYLIKERKVLTGAEIRFLRHELDLSQRVLGDLLGRSSQTVARWEKGEATMDGPADRLVRLMYEHHAEGKGQVNDLLKELAELDNALGERRLQFEDTDRGWHLHIAA